MAAECMARCGGGRPGSGMPARAAARAPLLPGAAPDQARARASPAARPARQRCARPSASRPTAARTGLSRRVQGMSASSVLLTRCDTGPAKPARRGQYGSSYGTGVKWAPQHIWDDVLVVTVGIRLTSAAIRLCCTFCRLMTGAGTGFQADNSRRTTYSLGSAPAGRFQAG